MRHRAAAKFDGRSNGGNPGLDQRHNLVICLSWDLRSGAQASNVAPTQSTSKTSVIGAIAGGQPLLSASGGQHTAPSQLGNTRGDAFRASCLYNVDLNVDLFDEK